MSVRQPRVRDRGDGAIRFTSAILPRYLRRAKSLEDLLPWLYRTKGCLSRKTAMAMVFKLCQCAQRKWRKLDGSNHLAEIIRGVKFVDGERQDRAAA